MEEKMIRRNKRAVKNLVVSKGTDALKAPSDPLTAYIQQISRYPLLSPEQELELATELKKTGDLELAKKLVVHNLRLVVKIAMEYRSAWQNIMDLIQEGNIGLMKAVSKYDPEKGAKLSSYASWWIRSYILKFILDNFRLVKIGTTNEQKKLFYNLLKEKNRLLSLGKKADVKTIAENLGVSEKAVSLMDTRLSSTEVSLDRPIDKNEEGQHLKDLYYDTEDKGIEEILSDQEGLKILRKHMGTFIDRLDERDKEIFKKRLLSEIPHSLQSIANDYGVSRERIRQIEERLRENLKVYMAKYLGHSVLKND